MNARTLTGGKSNRARSPLPGFAAAAVMAAMVFALALGVGRETATAIDGDTATAGADSSSDLADSASLLDITPIPTEAALPPDPTASDSAVPTPAGAEPAEQPISEIELTPTETPAAPVASSEPTPTSEAAPAGDVPIDGAAVGVRAAAESTTIEIGSCLPAVGSTDQIDQGGAGVYSCAATITVAAVPAFTEIVLDWTITADTTPGWTAELRRQDAGGNGAEEEWIPGAAPGLGVIEILGADDDADGDSTDGTFLYDVHFGVRLNAPSCGGPIAPDVALTSSVLPTIDGASGWRRHGELDRTVQPVLTIAAPTPHLSRGATGRLEDSVNPLRFSHADQLVDAGTLDLTVTSGYCGGWNVSISATDFLAQASDTAFGVGNLVLAATATGPGAPHPAAALTLSNDDRSIVSASFEPLPAGTYTYSFSLTLTIPGGTPPGIYTSTVTVTTSAAP